MKPGSSALLAALRRIGRRLRVPADVFVRRPLLQASEALVPWADDVMLAGLLRIEQIELGDSAGVRRGGQALAPALGKLR